MIGTPLPRWRFLRLPAVSLPMLSLVFLCIAVAASAQPRLQTYAWMEAETPATANVKFQAAGWGHQEFLSGQKWLQAALKTNSTARSVNNTSGWRRTQGTGLRDNP